MRFCGREFEQSHLHVALVFVTLDTPRLPLIVGALNFDILVDVMVASLVDVVVALLAVVVGCFTVDVVVASLEDVVVALLVDIVVEIVLKVDLPAVLLLLLLQT